MSRRLRTVYRDTIEGIKDPPLRRLAQQAGIKRVRRWDFYQESRFILNKTAEDLVRSAAGSMEFNKRKTLDLKDVEFALKRVSLVYGGITSKKCKIRSKAPKGGTKRRVRQGTESLRDIRYYQKHSDCLILPKGPFLKLLKEHLQQVSDSERISNDARLALQLAVESLMVDLYRNALDLAVLQKSQTVKGTDLRAARRISGSKA